MDLAIIGRDHIIIGATTQHLHDTLTPHVYIELNIIHTTDHLIIRTIREAITVTKLINNTTIIKNANES